MLTYFSYWNKFLNRKQHVLFNGDFDDCIVAAHPQLLFCSVECKTLKTNVIEMITEVE